MRPSPLARRLEHAELPRVGGAAPAHGPVLGQRLLAEVGPLLRLLCLLLRLPELGEE